MKKLLIEIVSALLLLTGCSAASKVDTMKEWTFQYNEGTNDYSLFFGLCNSRNKYVSAPATVEIKIELSDYFCVSQYAAFCLYFPGSVELPNVGMTNEHFIYHKTVRRSA